MSGVDAGDGRVRDRNVSDRTLRLKMRRGLVVFESERLRVSNCRRLRAYDSIIDGDNNVIEGDRNIVFGDNNCVRGAGNLCYAMRSVRSNVVEERLADAQRAETSRALPLRKREKLMIERSKALELLADRIDAVDAKENNTAIEKHCLEPLAKRARALPNEFRRYAFELPDGVREARAPELECILCRDNERSVLFFPCSHFEVCRDCVLMLIDKNDACKEPLCPTCRQPVKYTKRVYL